jgi:hypothetical protein
MADPVDRTDLALRLCREAMDLDPPARGPFIAEHAADDPTLKQQIERLLHFAERRDPPTANLNLSLAQRLLQQSALKPGARYGAFELKRELGFGGMGTVWLAQRVDGQFEQTVALKLIRGGIIDPNLVTRFGVERNILAQLNHPNIARLIDGGVSAAGEPWFAMEYVEGEPLLDYAERKRLSIAARIELLQAVCAAVAHAHRNLVVHRDLKPSHVLVDHLGQVKLLDFGVAKLLKPASREHTQTGSLAFTPAYAAPEQITGQAISTATDVHALGLILHELLCGRRPFSADSTFEIQRAIVQDPPRQLIRALADDVEVSESLARERGLTPATLKRLLRGDLQAVVSKALEKDPAKRYPSIDAMSADLGRFLDGRAVTAVRASVAAHVARWIGRNRLLAGALAAALFSLIAGLLVSLVLTARAESARNDALLARDQARQSLAFLERTLGLSDSELAGRPNVSLRSLLAVARQRSETLAAPVRSSVLLAMARAYAGIGDDQSALSLSTQAERVASHAAQPEIVVSASLERAEALLRSGGLLDAERVLRQLSLLTLSPELAVRVQLLQFETEVERGVPKPNHAERIDALIEQARTISLTPAGAAARSHGVPIVLNGMRLKLDWLAHAARADMRGYREWLSVYRDAAQRELGTDHPQVITLDLERLLYPDPNASEAATPASFVALAARAKEALGLDHPVALQIELARAVQLASNDSTAADQSLRQVIERSERALGPDHPLVLRGWLELSELSAVHDRTNDADFARFESLVDRACAQAASKICRWALRRIANDARNLARFDLADTVNRRLIQIYATHFGEHDWRTDVERVQHARLKLWMNDAAAAEPMFAASLGALAKLPDLDASSMDLLYVRVFNELLQHRRIGAAAKTIEQFRGAVPPVGATAQRKRKLLLDLAQLYLHASRGQAEVAWAQLAQIEAGASPVAEFNPRAIIGVRARLHWLLGEPEAYVQTLKQYKALRIPDGPIREPADILLPDLLGSPR